MSAGWNAMPEEREAAKRMWDGGMSRRAIAAQLQVSENTVSKWRWLDGWENRSRYEDRPIKHPARQTYRGPAHGRAGPKRQYQARSVGQRVDARPEPTQWRCRCGGPADSPDGHERCRAA